MTCDKCGREALYEELDAENVCPRCNEEFHAMFKRLYRAALERGTLVRGPKGVGSPNFTIGNEYLVDGRPMLYLGLFLGDETEFYREITHVFETRDGSDYRVYPESDLDSVGYLL
jgi:hypothetical protein